METTVAKIVYSPCPPSSKDVIWGKTVNGKIEFQTFGNEGWKTVAKEDILKDIFQIKEEILEELEDYIDEVIPQADWNHVDGISLDVVYCEDSTGYMFDRSKYYDVSTVTDVTFTIPAITKAEIYKGTLHSASITVPSETFITGDKSLLTISGTTITASSSKWYTWTYDSYTKEMKFSMYKEI